MEKLQANILALSDVILKLKPPTSKGIYLKSITLSATHGPGVKIDSVSVRNLIH